MTGLNSFEKTVEYLRWDEGQEKVKKRLKKKNQKYSFWKKFEINEVHKIQEKLNRISRLLGFNFN